MYKLLPRIRDEEKFVYYHYNDDNLYYYIAFDKHCFLPLNEICYKLCSFAIKEIFYMLLKSDCISKYTKKIKIIRFKFKGDKFTLSNNEILNLNIDGHFDYLLSSDKIRANIKEYNKK
ncbi:hypothetical protein F1B92_05740 [Campylobacter sp. FMV-PI01]|uniref:Uncharacterized protein n=1 Tax=Campylobacter portucalensis TaxID=2608384 RepID=A0A6L5WHY5_9BACT|nr:hypothetical protein [Campylobacter portucalensis]MSN96664.1 hypothetical protein [Campylobacter portucalensis]